MPRDVRAPRALGIRDWCCFQGARVTCIPVLQSAADWTHSPKTHWLRARSVVGLFSGFGPFKTSRLVAAFPFLSCSHRGRASHRIPDRTPLLVWREQQRAHGASCARHLHTATHRHTPPPPVRARVLVTPPPTARARVVVVVVAHAAPDSFKPLTPTRASAGARGRRRPGWRRSR